MPAYLYGSPNGRFWILPAAPGSERLPQVGDICWHEPAGTYLRCTAVSPEVQWEVLVPAEGSWEPLTDGAEPIPNTIFANGRYIMVWVPV